MKVTNPGDTNHYTLRVYFFARWHLAQTFWLSMEDVVRIVLDPFALAKNKGSRQIYKRMQAWKNLAQQYGAPQPRRSRPNSGDDRLVMSQR